MSSTLNYGARLVVIRYFKQKNMLQLFMHPASPPSRAVLSFLKLNRIPHNSNVVDLIGGQQRTKEYLAMNSMGQVPLIRDGEYVLAECQAILAYLHGSRHCPDSQYPADLKKRGLVDRHLHWYHTNIRLGGMLFRKMLIDPLRGNSVSQESIEETKSILQKSLQQMEEWLGTQTYVAGNELTIADLGSHAYCVQVAAVGYDLTSYPKVTEWTNRINAMQEIREVNQPFWNLVAQIKQRLQQKP